MASSNPSKTTEQPSMIGGHAQYAKGYVEETVGNVTGSKEWIDSGKKDAQEGIETMKVCFLQPESFFLWRKQELTCGIGCKCPEED